MKTIIFAILVTAFAAGTTSCSNGQMSPAVPEGGRPALVTTNPTLVVAKKFELDDNGPNGDFDKKRKYYEDVGYTDEEAIKKAKEDLEWNYAQNGDDPKLFTNSVSWHVDECFIVNLGGRMASDFAVARSLLKGRLNQLKPSETFTIIMMSSDQTRTFGRSRQISADKANLMSAVEFIDNSITAGGTTLKPLLFAGLKDRPASIWVFTNGINGGEGDPDRDTLRAVKTENLQSRSVINTVLFTNDLDAPTQRLLYELAHMNGGNLFDTDWRPVMSRPDSKR